jgi:hypothetical protein
MKPAAPLVIDFAPHRIRYAGYADDLLWIAVNEYPLAFGVDDDGRIVRTTHAAPAIARKPAGPDVVKDGRSIAWRGRQMTIAENARVGTRYLPYDWGLLSDGLASAGPDAFVCIAPSRVLLVPFEWTPADRVDVRRVKHAVPERPLEDATVMFAGPERVLVEHAKRGRFWLDAPKTGLTKGARVRIGGFFSEHGPLAGVGEPQPWFAGQVAAHKLIATVLAYGDEIVRLPLPTVPDDGELVHFGDAGSPPRAEPTRAPKKMKKLVSTLVAHGLAPKQTAEELDEIAESAGWTEDDDIGDDAAANILAELHREKGTGRAHGFIALDVRWGNDTNDVVAEFANALGDEAKAIASVRPPNAERGDDLDAFVRKLNAMLEAAGAARRIYALETAGDWTAHIARTPEEVATLKRSGVRGIRLP